MYNQEQNTGLNGFRNWLRRNLGWISGAVAIINPGVGAALKALDIAMGDEVEGQRAYEPTTAEQVILDKWVKEKLTPFYSNLNTQFQSVFNGPSPSTQLLVINEIMAKICVVRGYFATNETNGLSKLAVEKRMELIDIVLNVIEDSINDSFVSDNIVSETSTYKVTNNGLFNPFTIPLNTSYACIKYTNTVPIAQQNNAPILPIKPVVINPVTNETIKVNPTTGEPIKTKKNDDTIMYVFFGLALAIGLFFNKKESSNKN
jgi:hypothetical protein